MIYREEIPSVNTNNWYKNESSGWGYALNGMNIKEKKKNRREAIKPIRSQMLIVIRNLEPRCASSSNTIHN